MSKHFLALHIPDIYNNRILTVADQSVYSDKLGVDCPLLELYAPGYMEAAKIEVTKDFIVNLDACKLGIQDQDCEKEQACIPDGIYIVKYSVSPHSKVYVEYNYLRITKIMNQYFHVLESVGLSTCEPTVEMDRRLHDLNLIKNYIDTAKIKVEIKHRPSEGLQLLSYAKKLLDKFQHKFCN